jgi:hypothetical protein
MDDEERVVESEAHEVREEVPSAPQNSHRRE